MRSLALVLVGLLVTPMTASPVLAQAWLTVSGSDGSFTVDMPVPFEMPAAETEPDGTVIFAYVHETPDVALRLVVVDSAAPCSGAVPDGLLLVSRSEVGSRVLQSRVRVAGQRTYRLSATSTPELEGDPMIRRFLMSMRLQD
jgi:hypothetical protein